jgi:DNA polymerase-1
VVDSRAKLAELAGLLADSGGFAFDVETDSLDPITAGVVGMSFAVEEGKAFYVPVGHTEGGPLSRDTAFDALRPVLEDPAVPKYGQNIKFDYEVLTSNGIVVTPLSFDTMVASYLLEPGRRQHGLSALALQYLGVGMTPIERLIGKGGEQMSFAEVDVEPAGDYACADADVTLRLSHVLRDRLQEEKLTALLEDVEMPLVRVLAGMELAGVELDVSILEDLSRRLGREIDELRARVCELAGIDFNLDSPKQVGQVLFERLELPTGKRTKTGYSTDIDVLEGLRDAHEVPGLILEYRQLQKLKTGYLDALPGLVNGRTGRVHTSFNQTVASTGRLSSSNPNLQNIPVRTELGREVRKAFVAANGHVLLSADYSQIELRIMAHLSGDANLIDSFHRGLDVHRSTAASMFQVPEGQVTPEQRDQAKTINFGIMYGMGRFGLARRLGISTDEAAAFIDRYFETYPGVADYTGTAIEQATERGYAMTMLGRKRPISGLDSDNARVRSVAERIAVNTPIQGSAADLIKLAMISIDDRIRTEGLPARMVLQVHDELVFEVEEGEQVSLGELVRSEMEQPDRVSFDVPIVANLAHGRNWYEAHA